ncbi:hypothetical protein KBW81_12775 [Loktanella salsilacus]|uniref:hypothetical protein n=1 Tax=Loktanella salsilacus TaxID=195913 RepID=UPI0020B6CDD1|nr:hypothetical protein [Loktanella salsilacus]UTH47580.1 hypothetical protein KBW81_12775 [Loktanella salsilacus]
MRDVESKFEHFNFLNIFGFLVKKAGDFWPWIPFIVSASIVFSYGVLRNFPIHIQQAIGSELLSYSLFMVSLKISFSVLIGRTLSIISIHVLLPICRKIIYYILGKSYAFNSKNKNKNDAKIPVASKALLQFDRIYTYLLNKEAFITSVFVFISFLNIFVQQAILLFNLFIVGLILSITYSKSLKRLIRIRPKLTGGHEVRESNVLNKLRATILLFAVLILGYNEMYSNFLLSSISGGLDNPRTQHGYETLSYISNEHLLIVERQSDSYIWRLESKDTLPDFGFMRVGGTQMLPSIVFFETNLKPQIKSPSP